MIILAIETSCDETAIAIVDIRGPKTRPRISVLSHIISSQVKLHAPFGGVVPNVAKREHQKNLIPLLLHAVKEAGLDSQKLKIQNSKPQRTMQNTIEKILEREPRLLSQFTKKIIPLPPPPVDAIAVTSGPGLAPALWVGVNFARALATRWEMPLIPVNHMAGHLYSPLLKTQSSQRSALNPLRFPALALLVSGGHTELVLTRGYGKYKIIGETLDDAAGEAFDKVARLLGLPYPGGPEISALAEKKTKDTRQKIAITLPRPMIHSKNYHFSFSGLKTAVLYLIDDRKKKNDVKQIRPAIAKEFQNAVIEVLIKKTIRAAKEYRAKTILLGGGVAANKQLRRDLERALRKEMPRSRLLIPQQALTGDNALMIALAAYFTGKKMAPNKVGAEANKKLS